MKLSQLAAKPQLIEIALDDEQTIAEHGEALTFHTWDRQPLDVFMRLAVAQQNDQSAMLDIIRTMMLDEHGKQIISDDAMLPTGVLIRAIGKLTDTLGK
jgi:hypothetical protein